MPLDSSAVQAPPPNIQVPESIANMKFDTSKIDEMLNSGGEQVIKVGGQEVKEEKPVITGTQEVGAKPVEKVVEKKVEEPPKKEAQKPVEKFTVDPEPLLKPPVEFKKEEKKVEETVKPVEPPKKEEIQDLSKLIKPPEQAGESDDKFDYTAFQPEVQVNLRNMSNQSRKWASELLKENKSLKDNRQGTLYEHEQGYTLTPEFNEIQRKDYFNKVEASAWQDALLNIRQGKPYKNIIGFDPKTGQAVLGPEMQPNDQDQLRVEQNLAKCVAAVDTNKQTAMGMAMQHSSRVKADLATIDSVRKERFSWAQDPKVLEYTLKGSNGQEHKIKDIISNFKSVWPSYMHNHPAVQVAADMMVALEIRTAELRNALAKATVSDIKAAEAKRAEISSNHQPTDDGKQFHEIAGQKVPKTFSLDMMPNNS